MEELLTPRNITLYLTHRCNLSCPFCYYREFQKEGRKDLPAEEWFRLIDELAGLKVLNLTLLGGEPLIREDFREIVRKIVEVRTMRFTIISNGTLLTPELAGFLAGTRRCGSFQVSVDGMEKEHDRIRGEGSWRKAVRALKLLKEAGIPARATMVATRSNYLSVKETVRFLASETGVNRIRVNIVSDNTTDSSLPEEHGCLNDEEFVRLTRDMVELHERYGKLVENSSPLLFYKQMKSPTEPTPANPFRRCTGLWQNLTVRADGAILTCQSREHTVIGRINRDSIGELWHSAPLLREYRSAVKCGRKLPPECDTCVYNWLCGELCPANDKIISYCWKKIAKMLNIHG